MGIRPIDTLLRWTREAGLNQSKLAERLGVAPQDITNWKRRGMPPEKHKAAADAFGRTIDELVGRTEAVLKSGRPLKSAKYADHANEVIPQFDTGGAMGGSGLILRDQPGVIQSWQVTPEWIQKNVKNATSVRNLCIVTGFGDSMRPLFNPGDPLIVDRGVTTVGFDAIYFFRVGIEGFIKRLQRIPGRGLVALSENRSYLDWVVEPGMDFEIFGRVLKIWRGEDF